MRRLLLIPMLFAMSAAIADGVSPPQAKREDGQTKAAALLGGPQSVSSIALGSTAKVAGERPADAQAQAAALLSRPR